MGLHTSDIFEFKQARLLYRKQNTRERIGHMIKIDHMTPLHCPPSHKKLELRLEPKNPHYRFKKISI